MNVYDKEENVGIKKKKCYWQIINVPYHVLIGFVFYLDIILIPTEDKRGWLTADLLDLFTLYWWKKKQKTKNLTL